MKPAVALASGGLDSSTAIALARNQGFEIHALTFDYGQRHRCELDAARRVVAALGISNHIVIRIDLRAWRPALRQILRFRGRPPEYRVGNRSRTSRHEHDIFSFALGW